MRRPDEFTRDSEPGWAILLAGLLEQLGDELSDGARLAKRTEAWVLLNAALRRYLRRHAARMGRFDPADLEDIASEKSLELVARAESRTWRVSRSRAAGELAAYLDRVARNGIVDALRARARQADFEEEHRVATDGRTDAASSWADRGPGPDSLVESRDFVAALSECAGALPRRSFIPWFLRVFHDMSTREIATHPDVGLKPGHVDVILMRAREAISRCMQAKGHDPAGMPPGTFIELWRQFRSAEFNPAWRVSNAIDSEREG